MLKDTYLKKVYRYKHHCNKCNQEIRGNGSEVTPYNCGCGVWRYNFKTNQYEL